MVNGKWEMENGGGAWEKRVAVGLFFSFGGGHIWSHNRVGGAWRGLLLGLFFGEGREARERSGTNAGTQG